MKNLERPAWLSKKNARHLEHLVIENPHLFRDAFMKDQGMIIHSNFFKRLAHKTQVYSLPINDHLRTRMTHTLEASQIARQLARFMMNHLSSYIKNANEEVKFYCQLTNDVETLAVNSSLIHDIGHPPFGHIGQKIIENYDTSNLFEFDDNKQVIRILLNDQLYPNLSPTVALICSSLKKKKTKENCYEKELNSLIAITQDCGVYDQRHPVSLIMEAADDISYICSDILDYLKYFKIKDHNMEQLFRDTGFEKLPFYDGSGKTFATLSLQDYFFNKLNTFDLEKIEIFYSLLVKALISHACEGLKKAFTETPPNTLDDITSSLNIFIKNFGYKNNSKTDDNILYWNDPAGTGEAIYNIKHTFQKKIFYNRSIAEQNLTARNVLHALLDKLLVLGDEKYNGQEISDLINFLPKEINLMLDNAILGIDNENPYQVVIDYITGMTDRYAIQIYEKLISQKFLKLAV